MHLAQALQLQYIYKAKSICLYKGITDAQYINPNIVYQPILGMHFYAVHYNVVMHPLIVFIYCFNKIVYSFNIV